MRFRQPLRRWLSYDTERMNRVGQRYETPKWRTFWLLLAFAVLVGIGVVTVLLPELEDEPEESQITQPETKEDSTADSPSQE